ncbi:MAG: tyrosine-type recombinase/integrase [Burkholderiales bacterium]
MSVHKPSNSSNYHFRFMHNNRIYTGSCKTSNKKQAEAFEEQRRRQIFNEVELGMPEEITLKAALTEYLDKIQGTKKSKHLASKANKLLGFTIGRDSKQQQCFGFEPDKLFHTLTDRDIQRLISHRQKEGYATATILYELGLLNQTITYIRRLGYKVPTIDLKSIKKENDLRPKKQQIRFLSVQEDQMLLDALNPANTWKGIAPPESRSPEQAKEIQDNFDFIVLLLDLGCRYSELSKLKWHDVDLVNRMVRLYRGKVNNESYLYLTNRAYEVLARRFESRTSEFIFESKDGTARGYNYKVIKAAAKRAGLKNVSYHTLRKTLASRLVQAGLTINAVQQILGHSNPNLTAQYYAELAPSQASAQAVLLLNKIQEG